MYKLARPFNAFSGALAVFLGGYVAGTGAWGDVAVVTVPQARPTVPTVEDGILGCRPENVTATYLAGREVYRRA